MNEGLSEEELQTAIFTLTLNDTETWSAFKPMPLPKKPAGLEKVLQTYDLEKKEDLKSKLWVEMTHKDNFKTYFYELNKINLKNDSDVYFLHEMKMHFKKHNMTPYEEKVKIRLDEYENEKQR